MTIPLSNQAVEPQKAIVEAIAGAIAPEPLTDLTYSFKISRRATPKEFRNLWELIVKTPTDTKPMQLIDADSLETLISRIRLIFEQDGL